MDKTMKLYWAGSDAFSMPIYHAILNGVVYSSDIVQADVMNETVTLDGTTYQMVVDTNGPTHYFDSNNEQHEVKLDFEKVYSLEEVQSLANGTTTTQVLSASEAALEDLIEDKIAAVQDVLSSFHYIKNSPAMSNAEVSKTVTDTLDALGFVASTAGVTSFSERISSGIEIELSDWDWFQDEYAANNPGLSEHFVHLLHPVVADPVAMAAIQSAQEVASDFNSLHFAEKNYDSSVASIIVVHANMLREIVSSNKVAHPGLSAYESNFRSAIDSNSIVKLAYDFGLPLDEFVLKSDSDLMTNVLTFMKLNASTWQAIVKEYEEAKATESSNSTAKYVSIALGLKNPVTGENMTLDELMAVVGDLANAADLAQSVSAAIEARVGQLETIMVPIVGQDATSGLINALMNTTSQLLSVLFGTPGYNTDGSVDVESSTGFIRIFVELGDLLKGVDYVLEHMSGDARNNKLTKLLVSKVDGLITKLASAIG